MKMIDLAVEIWREMNVSEETIKRMRARNETVPAMRQEIPRHEVQAYKDLYREIYFRARIVAQEDPEAFARLYQNLQDACAEKHAQN